MKITVLIDYNEHRTNLWNGEIIRIGGVGVSGTEQSFVILGEELAKLNYEVTIISPTCLPNTSYMGVQYKQLDGLQDISNITDILILQTDNRYFINYSWLKLKKIIFWYHSQRFIPVEMLQLFSRMNPNCEIICNTMTQYAYEYMKSSTPYVELYTSEIFQAYNPFMLDIFKDELKIKEKNSFIFHAGFDRGGEVAYNVFNKMRFPNKKMYICGYDTLRLNNTLPNIIFLNSLDKTQLFSYLSKSEYFVYPLVASQNSQGNPANYVHKDTFGCVIAEALAHEVIVITFPIGAVKEIWGDYILYIPFPPDANITSLNSFETSFDPTLGSEVAQNNIIQIIQFFETKPELKELIKKRGREFVLSKLKPVNITKQWVSIIN
jgi:glycosyltransferase involved in cell wall biosynthesis